MSRPAARTPARFGLPDTDRIRADLVAVGLFSQSGPTDGSSEIMTAISRSGRPALAVQGLARLFEAADDQADLMAALRNGPRFRGRLIALLGASTVLAEHLAAWPEDWHSLLPEAPSEALLAPQDIRDVLFAAVGIDPTLPLCTGTEGGRATVTGGKAIAQLRRAYRSLLLVIAAHDLAPAVEPSLPTTALPAVCQALSDLADATLQSGLAVAAAALPAGATPARLAVIAMGKCGAKELNYLSDVDVIFAADHPLPKPANRRAGDRAAESGASDVSANGNGPGTEPQSLNEAGMLATASQLAAGLMRICGSAAWEVDAALRPEGKAGALVRTPAGLTSYYQRWAHTWEFQALLKARPAAGDPALGQQFLDITAPGVWSAAGRDSFVDDVQKMRRRVEENIPERERDRELKLGAGGLRDVEFAVQLLQLVHGRTDPGVRLPGTLMGLRSLIRGGYVGRSDGAEMAAAYTFLRRAEHRLQLQRLRRTHLLPEDSSDMEWLARSDGYTASGTASAAEVFIAERVRHSGTVRRLHEKLFYRPLLHAVAAVGEDETRLSPEAATARFAALGFTAPEAALRHLAALTLGVSRRAAIQRTLLPVLLDYFSSSPDPDGGLLSYRQVSEALADTPWYLRLLRDEGEVAGRLATLLGGSRLIASLLPRAPEVLRLLVDDAALLEPEPETVAAALLARCRRASTARESVDAARSARRHEMLRLACGDLLGLISVTNIARGLTSVAETSMRAAYDAAVEQVISTRGGFRAKFAVIGMGRLGGAELSYSSDADVMFVMEPLPDADDQLARADAAAVADLMSRLLGRPSPDPPLEIDANLRPEGKNGPLVRTLESYHGYWARVAAP
ncbi:MAG: bifunctional [glutamine synthetase] adenylyltransferase/[glutamine synthetase]-adenylyl-L-tyrosine phosphorylase, partial [Nakamurella sp.]